MVIFGDLLLAAMALYALAGVMFAFRFVVAIAPTVNDRAQLAGPFFRVSLIPAAVLLWPWLMYVQRRRSTSSTFGEDGA